MAGDFESMFVPSKSRTPRSVTCRFRHIPRCHASQSDQQMFAGRASRDKDPRESLHIEQVLTPELAAVPHRSMASVHQLQHGAVLDIRARLDLRIPRSLCPDQPRRDPAQPYYHVLGSDARRRSSDRSRSPHRTRRPCGCHCLSVEPESPLGHNDTMMDPEQRIWGFETNFGGLAGPAIVKANRSSQTGALDVGGSGLPGTVTPRPTVNWCLTTVGR